MGTRHIIKVRKNGKDWISQYGQWDGYPTGQGEDVMKFVKSSYWMRSLENAIDAGDLVALRPSELDALVRTMEKLEKKDPLVYALISQMWRTSSLHRDAGAKALTMLAHGVGKRYVILEEYSGWEQYQYLIDLDKRILEIREFNHDAHVRTYDFDTIAKMSDKEIEDEMKRLEEMWENEE